MKGRVVDAMEDAIEEEGLKRSEIVDAKEDDMERKVAQEDSPRNFES